MNFGDTFRVVHFMQKFPMPESSTSVLSRPFAHCEHSGNTLPRHAQDTFICEWYAFVNIKFRFACSLSLSLALCSSHCCTALISKFKTDPSLHICVCVCAASFSHCPRERTPVRPSSCMLTKKHARSQSRARSADAPRENKIRANAKPRLEKIHRPFQCA